MILETFAVITALGIITFVVGYVLGLPELAFIGAVIVVGVGAAGYIDGIVVESGYMMDDTGTYSNTTYNYEEISTVTSFPFEFVIMMMGAVMAFRSLGELSEQ